MRLRAVGVRPCAFTASKMAAPSSSVPSITFNRPVNYLAIKHLHITCAVLSGSFFLLRGLWMLTGSPLLLRRWVRVLPHVVDTLLLATALVLVFWSGQYPFVQPWLTAKVLALVAYIVAVALTRQAGLGF